MVTCDDDARFILFDPQRRNSEGYFDYSEKSSISCCKTVRDEIFAQCRYICVPLQRKNILSRLIHEIHNSQRFVDEYLNGVRWMESSGSSDDDSEIEDSDGGKNRLSKKTDADTLSDRKIRAVKAPIRCSTHPFFLEENYVKTSNVHRRRNARLMRKQLWQF